MHELRVVCVVVVRVLVVERILVRVVAGYDDEHHDTLAARVREVILDSEGGVALAFGTEGLVASKVEGVGALGRHTEAVVGIRVVAPEVVGEVHVIGPVHELPVIAPLTVVSVRVVRRVECVVRVITAIVGIVLVVLVIVGIIAAILVVSAVIV